MARPLPSFPQWLVAEPPNLLGSQDAQPDDGSQPDPVPVHRGHIPHKYRKSGAASMLAAGLIGLREILDPAKDQRSVIEQQTNDDDIKRPIEVFLDPDNPAASIVVIRDPADNN
ncbi:unannotated protein [freshwater metagenome]|uniref:Unannotated protein n=1 Tax=freshwater metagenome TaxID=449393 RepID=A0A6J6CR91_9ZZZZ